jgi:hypothetical protein
LSLRIPLGNAISGSLRVGAGVIASPFTREELDPNFEPRTLWRRSVTARLEYRL